MEFKLYYCSHCKNIAWKIVDKGVPLFCCGQKMEELVPNTSDGAVEKHVPVVEKKEHGSGYAVSVKVGSVEHPMAEDHWIGFVAAVADDTLTVKQLNPGEKPELNTFSSDGKVTAYEWCNLHGYWSGT